MIVKKSIIRIGCALFLFQGLSFAENDKPVLDHIRDAGAFLWNSVVQADYRELQIDELISIDQISIPAIQTTQAIQHPVLLFNSSQSSRIRLRLHKAPYRMWAENILNAAYNEYLDPSSPLLKEVERSAMAKQCAFAYFLTGDNELGEMAKEALRSIRSPDPIHSIEGGKENIGWGDWLQASDALMQYAVAYDLMYNSLSDLERNQIEQNLSDMTDQMARHINWIPKNNHAIDIGSAIGTIALVLPHPHSKQWADAATELLRGGLHMIEPDGSHREGVYYARYIASRLYPFFVYLNNRTGMNLFEHRRIRRFNRWLVDMEKPDGSMVLFDDAFPEALFYQPYGVGLSPEGAEMRWLFELNETRFSRDDPFWIDVFCAFDDRIRAVEPDYGNAIFYPDGGYAVFRGEKDIYGLMLAEPGRPHLSGHDHIEPGDFTLSAFGKDWLIDAGYAPGGTLDDNRLYYIKGEAHNIPLVNGLGPLQNPIYGDKLGGDMAHYFSTKDLAFASVEMDYRNAQLNRKLYFVGQNYFVVHDKILADSLDQITVPWHIQGTFHQLDHQKVLWQQEDVSLYSEFLTSSDESFLFETRQALHTQRGQTGHHTALHIHLPSAKSREMLSLFIPQNGDNLNPVVIPVSVLSPSPAIARQIGFHHGNSKDILILAESDWQCAGFESDARFAILHQSDDNNPVSISLQSASYFIMQGDTLFKSDIPVDLSVQPDPAGWFGYIDWDIKDYSKVTIRFYTHLDPGVFWLEKTIQAYQWDGRSFNIELDRTGRFETGTLRSRIQKTERYRDAYPMLHRMPQITGSQRDLTRAEITRLGNEGFFAFGQTALQASDSLLGTEKGIANLYKTLGGLANHAWNQAGPDKWTLPQRIELDDKLFGYDITYHEEGLYTRHGVDAQYHRITVDDRLTYQLQNHPWNQSNHFLFYRQEQFSFTGSLQNMKDQNDYQLSLSRNFRDGWLTLSQNHHELAGNNTSYLSFGKGAWLGNVSYQYLEQNPDALDFQTQYRSEHYSTLIQGNYHESQGWQNVRVHQTWQPAQRVFWDFLFYPHIDSQSGHWKTIASTNLWMRSRKVNGLLSFHRNPDGSLYSRWNATLYRGKWRISQSGWWDESFHRNVSIARRDYKLSGELSLLDNHHIQARTVWHPLLSQSGIFNFKWDTKNSQWKMLGAGFYSHQDIHLGGEINYQHEDAWEGFIVTGALGLPVNSMESIHLFASICINTTGALESYQIQIMQYGRMRTPGILIEKDSRGQVRFEGYLMWYF